MRFVSRGPSPVPDALSAKDCNGLTELERARAHMVDSAANPQTFPFRVYKADAVKDRLETLFFGKCAYCETFYSASAPVDVEHFRPKGGVEGEAHTGYWWLASDWDNLLPSCLDCNRRRHQRVQVVTADLAALQRSSLAPDMNVVLSGKGGHFPIAGTRCQPESRAFDAEAAILLDPTRDDPEMHLDFCSDPQANISLVSPRVAIGDAARSVRGAMSIQVYGLNRSALVQERTRLLRRLEFLEDVVARVGDVLVKLENDAAISTAPSVREASSHLDVLLDLILAEMRALAAPSAPYSAFAAAWIKAFLGRLG